MQMKKTLTKLFVLMLALVMCFGLAACNGDDDVDGGNTPTATLNLISGGTMNYKFVYTNESGTSVRRAVTNLVGELTRLGVSGCEAIGDGDSTMVGEKEIIVGTGVRNRDDCVIDAAELGEMGYVIKAVGNRIVIAGGTADTTKRALDIFKEKYLGIKEDTAALSDAAVAGDLNESFNSSYNILSVTIDGTPIQDFVITTDYGTDKSIAAACPSPRMFVNRFLEATGIEIPIKDYSATSSSEHRIVLKYVNQKSGAGDTGFRVYVNGNDLMVECAYWNTFGKAFESFYKNELLDKEGDIVLPSSYKYTYDANIVKYSDFGAYADGRTNDFWNLLRAHEFANQCGNKVVADGKEYYISDNLDSVSGLLRYIPVKTDVDFGTAKIIIDDSFDGAYKRKDNHIFVAEREYLPVVLNSNDIQALNGGTLPSVDRSTTSLSWLVSKLDAKSLVEIVNVNHKNYIRFGANVNEGYNRSEVLMVDKNGVIDATTPVIFDYEQVTNITVYRADDAPITMEGGRFVNICCRVSEETNYKNAYKSFKRGISVERANTTLKDINHKMQDEPARPTSNDQQNQSYPYYGFISQAYTYNSKVIDCDLTGHTVYAEDKSATSGAKSVQMGTYDLIVQCSINSYFENLTQSATPIHDSKYWGIMASNHSRNMTYKDCSMSRFDAHCGFWNLRLTGCDFGQYINVIGGGELYIDDVETFVGNAFIQLRGDYGATFEGDVTIKNSTHHAGVTYNSNSGGKFNEAAHLSESYIFNATIKNEITLNQDPFIWDFGYTCYMPRNIVIENYKSESNTTYVYNDLSDKHFDKTLGLNVAGEPDDYYRVTETITFKGTTPRYEITPNAGQRTWDDTIIVN